MKRNQNIPPQGRSVDGMIRSKRTDGFNDPFIRPRTVAAKPEDPFTEGARRPRRQNRAGSPLPSPKLSRADKKQQKKQAKALKKQKRSRTRRVIKRIFIILLIVVLVGGGYLGYKSWTKLRNIFRGGGNSAVLCGEVDPDALKTEGDGRVNILIMGIGGAEQRDGPNLTDTIMIASINPLDNSVKLLSVPRDLWVSIHGSYHKINEAYQTGLYDYQQDNPQQSDAWPAIQAGFTSANDVIGKAVGIPINFDVLITYEAFREAIDAVGGVDVNVAEDLVDQTMAWENGWNPVIAKKGLQHMESKQALMYVRSRETSARGDFDRAERQRAVLVALQEKILSAGTLTNPVKISNLLDAFGNNIRTNIGGNERTCLINIVRKVNGSQVRSIDLYDYVMGATSDAGSSIQVPRAGMYDFSKLQAYVRNQLKDSYLARENAEITVLNGTRMPGLATQVADELKSYGYNVTNVGDAPDQSAATTQIIDVSKKDSPRYTLHYLELRLGATTTKTLPAGISAGSAKIVILVGSDAASN